MGRCGGTAPCRVWYALTSPHKGVDDLWDHRYLRAIQILLGETKIENTVRYLGFDIEDALILAERTEIWSSRGPPQRQVGRSYAGRLCAPQVPFGSVLQISKAGAGPV